MIPGVQEGRGAGGQGRYALTESENGHVWGVCAEVDGLFREPRRGTYELFGWVPERAGLRGWLGDRVWLVPEDTTLDAWLLEDSEILGQHAWTDALVLTGLDDHLGPPEGHRATVRLHNEYRWLGSCREFARVLPEERAAPPLVLRGLAPSDLLRRALATGTRHALDLEEAWLEIRDDNGDRLTDRLLRPRIRAWHSSAHGPDLIDLELDEEVHRPVAGHARPLWDRWLAGPPKNPGAWAVLGTRQRESWLELVRERGCRIRHHDRPAGREYEMDGRHITDRPGLFLALGEAVNGPGGYFGGCLDAVVDCLRGDFGYRAPATLLWRHAAIARRHLSHVLAPDGQPYDLVDLVLEILTEGGMRVTLA
ncbi:barstar family protein [Streptomyces sp. enrichment culture]|uniref:barstar family protein n=1 Tax=Streptomyces sp. enrichment culture TaxID=1795815 RepID=UPI003F577780